jgi:glyoxylase-like metal-dependent hydrolase (beta-lactamase superfamily II)/ketosteroid isomerase-like protein
MSVLSEEGSVMAATDESTQTGAAEVARRYFEAFGAGDAAAMAACWAPGGREHVRGQADVTAPEGVREFFAGLFAAVPDWRAEVVTQVTEGERSAVQWRATGTFAGAAFNGIEATGARIELEGCDVLTVRDGAIQANDAFTDSATFARQIGMLPPQGSQAESRLAGALNLKTRLGSRIASAPEQIAEGVWIMRGGFPEKTMNVYFVRDGDGVLLFDAGSKNMRRAVATAGAQLGGITRVVLGHGHTDHRGVAPFLGVDVFCHPDNRADSEGDGGLHYFDYSKLDIQGRLLMPRLLKWWDGGPVKIAGTVSEGDDVAGFRVIDLPGHAPGLIGLWRESDRLALVSDCFYTLDPQTGKKGHARVPHVAFNFDTEQARASMRKLAALEPAAAWPGHADPLTGDVRSTLEHAADTT